MADEGNPYATVLENLQEYEGDIREAFMNVAAENELLSSDYLADVLNSISALFPFNCENAIQFFSYDNKELPENYDLSALSFEQFFELFGLWVNKKSQSYDLFTARSRENELNMPSNLDISAINASKDHVTFRSSPDTENNKKLLKELLKQNEKEYKNLYNKHLQEEQIELNIEACFNFLQECLQSSGIDLKEKTQSLKDSLKSLETEQIWDIAQRYFQDEKNIDSDDFDIKEATLAFKDCFDLLDYWLRNDENIVLIDKRRKGRAGEGGVTAALKETIEKYEKMIEETANETEREVLENTVQALKAQLSDLEKGKSRSKSVKDGVDYHKREEKRLKALKEIFDVYCLQQLNLGKFGTFDKYNRLSNTITLGTFKVILKDFRLKINHLKLVELFNKSTISDENMSFDEFLDFLSKVALRAEIVTETKVHQPNPEVKKEYRPDCYKKDSTYKTFKENEAKKKQVFMLVKKKEREALFKDQVKRDADTLEEIWEHMGLYDGSYKSWISLVRIPFHSRDKETFRINPESLTYKFKTKGAEGKDPKEVVEEIQRRNELRKLVKDLKTVEKSFMSNFKVASAHSMRTEHSISRQSKEDSYVSQQKNRTKQSLPNIKKLTMKGVENFQDDDLLKIDNKFNPQELIEENDEEDDVYLQEYNIEERKVKPQPDRDLKKYDNYGRLKKVSKGFAVNGKYGHASKQQESRNNFDRDDTYQANYSSSGYYDIRTYTNPKGTPVNNITVGPASVKQTKGANSLYKPISSDPHFKQIRNQPVYSSSEANISYNADYSRHANNHEYASANVPYVSTNGYILPKNTGYHSTSNRIERIQKEAYNREQQTMGNIISIQNHQMLKGLKTVRK